MIFIANTLMLNGGTTFLRRISRAYHESGHKVLIVVIQGPSTAEMLEAFEETATVKMLHSLFACKFSWNLESNAASFVPLDQGKIREMIREYGNHVHVMGVFGLYCALKFERLDPSVRISVGIYHQNEYILRGSLRGIATTVASLFKSVPVENVIMFNEHSVREYSEVMVGNYLARNIVPIGILPVAPLATESRVPYRIVSIGMLNGFKKYNEHVIGLLPELRKKYPRITYDIYGDGAERERLVGLVRSLGLSSCVTFHGCVPYREFGNVVSQAGVFVGSGTAILEAAVRGVPSVVGIEAVERPVTYGFIFDCEGYSYNEYIASRRTVPIAAKLEEVFEASSESLTEIASRCREKALQFTIDRTLDGFLRIERGLAPVEQSMTVVEELQFTFWIVVALALDLSGIDRSFRFRRDVA